MKTHRLQWFFHTPDNAVLRRYAEESFVDEAGVDRDELAEWIAETECRYEVAAEDPLQLAEFGKALYRWLDGAAQRRLEEMRAASGQGWALHIDTAERLRHLPWELLHDGSAFLCQHPTRPFTPVRRVDGFRNEAHIANRPLRVLFMASSPIDVVPELDFEKEEAQILQSTRHQPIELVVEESGSLVGLAERIESHEPGYFDILHFTGHATAEIDQPLFCLENDLGRLELADAGQIAAALKGRWPRLVFLSGCSTGAAPQAGLLPSLAESLVNAGAPAVLGWALPVYDATGIAAATGLYHDLAIGERVDAAVARVRARLLADGLPDWHLLRLYGNATALDALVTPLRTAGRGKIHWRPAQAVFLDAGGKTEICKREDFVGRRRQVQQALRVLRSFPGEESYHAGALLHGMGGLGKSSLAARLCERLTAHRRIVLVGRVDETKLLQAINAALADAQAAALLNENLALAARLRRLLEYLPEPVLLVFDDFEHNLDLQDGVIGLAPAAAGVIHAVLAAIHESASESRAIVTCRYVFPLSGPVRLYSLGLPSMHGADLAKKTASLAAWQSGSGIAADLRERAERLADGNPRLLERLDRLLMARRGDEARLFDELANSAAEFREEILLRALFAPLPEGAKRLLACAALIHMPVAWGVIVAAHGAPPEAAYRQALLDLGLLEESRLDGEEQRYYVSALLHPVVEGILSSDEAYAAKGRAAWELHRAEWGEGQGIAESRALEILRLALAGGEATLVGELGKVITNNWLSRHRYRETAALCEQVIPTVDHPSSLLNNLARAEEVLGRGMQAWEHYQAARIALQATPRYASQQREYATILHNIAGLELHRGNIMEALELWQESLELKESAGDLRGKTATLHNMALALAQQGKVEEALNLWRESLKISESYSNARGKAATLDMMAWVLAQQGKTGEALGLWREVQKIDEQTGDIRGKAVTLHNMAWVLAQQGKTSEALNMLQESLEIKESIGDVVGIAATQANIALIHYQVGEEDVARDYARQAAEGLAAVGAWPDLARCLDNFSQLEESVARALLAQGCWLARRVDVPLVDLVNLSVNLFEKLGPQTAWTPLLALTLAWRVEECHAGHPRVGEVIEAVPAMLGACAAKRGIDGEEAFEAWLKALIEPGREALERQLDAELEALVGGNWLFDPARVRKM